MVTEVKDSGKEEEVKRIMATKEQMDQIQESLRLLLAQNKTLTDDVAGLKKENQEWRTKAENKATRIETKKQTFEETRQEVAELVEKMSDLKSELLQEDVQEDYFRREDLDNICQAVVALCHGEDSGEIALNRAEASIKREPVHGIPAEKFTGTAKDEKMDCYFGEDSVYSAVAMRRFAERYLTVRDMNIQLRIAGWDDPAYRAGKIILSLKGDAFDYVKFAKSTGESWTSSDDSLLEKLKDKFINVQAIEMNILHFEQSFQEPKESISEYMSRLKRAVREAYDGDSQKDLDRKVAWRFVSGVTEKRVRDKILECGWMLNRQEAKPLDELEKIAEYTKRNEETSRAMSRSTGHGSVSMFDAEEGNVAAFTRRNSKFVTSRSKTPSSESKYSSGSGNSHSSGSSDLPLEFLQCYYCKQKHRGGWLYCSKRKKESPTWRPRSYGKRGNYPLTSGKDF